MTAPTSNKPPFWQRQNNSTGSCEERIVSKVWNLEPGPKHEHWDFYAAYSQEHLRQEVVSNWQAWAVSYPMALYVPWVWALKVYLWRFPLDTKFVEALRAEMGPFWLVHVRHSEEDWMWLYSVRAHISMSLMAPLLGILPTHPIGGSLAVAIPPVFEGYSGRTKIHYKTRMEFVLSEPAVGLLDNYADVLLHPQAHFYPRWRALLVCLHNSLLEVRKKKTNIANLPEKKVLDSCCTWLNLTPRTIWKGFDSTWIDFAKDKHCTTLDLWDAAIAKFYQPTDWREKLRASASTKKACTSVIVA